MDEQVLQAIREEIKATIKVVVNGKIDKLTELMNDHNKKHEKDMTEVREHITEVKPILEAYNGFNTAGNLVKWIAGVGTALGVLWMMLVSLTK